MAHTASAKKRARQNAKRNLRNRSVKHQLKTLTRKVLAAVDAKDAAAANAEFRVLAKRLDKAAARRIVHRNRVARTKSRLASRVAAIAAESK